MAVLDLADILTINNENADQDLATSDLLQDAPFFRSIPFVTATNGDEHQYVKETGAPAVGFRAVNTGRAHDGSQDTLVTENLKFLDCGMTIDEAVALAYKRGVSALNGREAIRHIRAGFRTAEVQYFQGVGFGGDALGFNGFPDAGGLNALADTMVMDGGGSSARTSIYLMRLGDDDVTGVMGMDGNIEIGETLRQRVQEIGDDTKFYFAFCTAISAWMGLQIGGAYSIGRIANVGATDCDDDLISQGIELFPEERSPNVIVMNKRSVGSLRRSRTATNPSGAPAPYPTEVHGIPIIQTGALSNAEGAIA